VRQRNSQLGGSLLYKCVDITDASAVNDKVDSIATRHGRIDGLVANAGPRSRLMRCNMWGTFVCATAVGRQMLEKKTFGGSIVRDNPGAREIWGSENMLRRIDRPHEFRVQRCFYSVTRAAI
jgi:NAD(P)-dependent dehydrogenase (short-subunit alcohol dehydrogenase family)